MPQSRGRRPNKAQLQPQRQQPIQVHPHSGKAAVGLIRHFWAIVLGFSVILTIVGGAFLFLPRVNIDVEKEPDFSSAFPNSVTVTNTGSVTLRNVTVSIGNCRAISDNGGAFTGRPDPSKCNGGALKGRLIHMEAWEGHTLVVDEKWTLAMPRRTITFPGNLASGDLDYLVSFWSWPVPFLRHTVEFRFSIQRLPNGAFVWTPVSVN
jgi:hypothetical protein